MELTLKELMEMILFRLDPDELIERLDLSTEEIVERFHDKIAERRHRFEDFEEDELGEETYEEDKY
tara:strand:+ start:87 stop:284 length:198 start_codon:yes stop_codon:yes gene_type:complete